MTLTPQTVLRGYILAGLAAMGGSGRKRQLLDWIDRNHGDQLTKDDRLTQPSNGEVKWENQTAWERNTMVDDGLIAPYVRGETVRGVWTLTESGWQAADSTRKHISP